MQFETSGPPLRQICRKLAFNWELKAFSPIANEHLCYQK